MMNFSISIIFIYNFDKGNLSKFRSEQVKVEFIYLMSISSGISNVVYSWAAQVEIMLSTANLIRHKYKK